MEKNLYLTLYLKGREPRVVNLDSFGKPVLLFGRGPLHGPEGSPENDIQVDDSVRIVSRAHCVFRKISAGWTVLDDKSKNGLYGDSGKVTGAVIYSGDRFTIGNDQDGRCVLAFELREEGREKEKGGRISLPESGSFVIGRGEGSDLVLSHPSVSRTHCIVTSQQGEYVLSDNNSLNGVILNGEPLKGSAVLHEMDRIQIADTTLTFSDGGLFSSLIEGGVSVAVKGVVKVVPDGKGEKTIMDHVRLSIEPGEFTAIIGGSGAGKTTLLNCMSGLTEFQGGDVLINGESVKRNGVSLRSIMGYVPQSDIVYDDLSLERMLMYSAQLRMPKDMPKAEIMKRVNEVLEMVELSDHRKTMIRKLSGGQKKRASIAVELLASPKLFFLDEPSSGLDPGTEKHLMEMLKRISREGRTVIMVTHTVQNINLCDRLICMGRGGLLCYSGKPEEASAFFGKPAFPEIYDDLNEHSREVSQRYASINRQEQLPEEMEEMEKDSRHGKLLGVKASRAGRRKKGEKREKARGLKQFSVMSRRYLEILLNCKGRLLLLLLGMPLLLSVIVCFAFQADGDLYNTLGIVINRTSFPWTVSGDTMKLLFSFSCAIFWVGIFNSIQEISKERVIYEREHFAGVKASPYVMSKLVVLGGISVIQALIMNAVFLRLTETTASIGANKNAVTAFSMKALSDGIVFSSGGMWMELFVTTLLVMLSAMCLGLLISSVSSNETALVLCPVCLLPQILFTGVVNELSGVSRSISNFITCRWACIAYFTSARINELYESIKYSNGSWTMTEYSNGFGVDMAYDPEYEYLFGLNPVLGSWLVLAIISAVCVALAIILLRLSDKKRKAR